MHAFTLVWGALKRRKARTIFTFLSVVVAFTLFCVLAAVRQGMLGQLRFNIAERLVTLNDVTADLGLPLSYYKKIAAVPGVTAVVYLAGFHGYFRDTKHKFSVDVTNVDQYLKVFPEFHVPTAQIQAWLADQQGAIAGAQLVKHMGWKLGETIPLQDGPMQKDGSTTWYFHLDGIYHADLPTTYQSYFAAHYQYYNQAIGNIQKQNRVGNYRERIKDPRDAAQISGAIDRLFENSTPQTVTQSEEASSIGYLRQFANISAIVTYVGIAVFFSMLLIIGNTMAQSVQERIAEFAMFRALGFKPSWLVWLVLRESLLLVVSSGVLGLILGYAVTRMLMPYVGYTLRAFGMTWSAAGLGVVLSIIFGLLSGLIPMLRMSRLQVADALRNA
ncbi:MAG: ABC transporter permease [Gammaproteobacteria bacterium]